MMKFAGIALILIGLYGLMSTKHVIRLVIALNILELGANLFIVSIGMVENGFAPILTAEVSTDAFKFVDPLPQALVLTAIVIGFGTTALALAFAKKIHVKYGTYDLGEIGGEK